MQPPPLPNLEASSATLRASRPGALLPFLAPLLLRFLPGRGRPGEPWSWHLDLPLLILLGLGMAALSGGWLYRFSMPAGTVGASDFYEYCENAALLLGVPGAEPSVNRSLLPALLPALLTPRFGYLDACILASSLSTGLVAAGAFLWARLLHGRLAGVAAATLVGAMTPLVLLSRYATTYPEMIGAWTLAAGLALLPIRFPRPLSFLGAGLGLALALLADVRGLLFALPFLLASLLGLPRLRPARALAGLLLLALPLAASWPLGHWAFEHNASLEGQAVPPLESFRAGRLYLAYKAEHPGYRWGHGSLLELPATFRLLAEISRLRSGEASPGAEGWERFERFLGPLLPATLLGLLAAAWSLRRQPLLLLGLAITASPFAFYLHGAVTYQSSYVRHLAVGLPLLPVLLGLGYGWLVQGPLQVNVPRPPPRRLPALLHFGLAASLPLLAVLGVLRTPLAPDAPWRHYSGVAASQPEILRALARARRLDSSSPVPHRACLCLLREELARGGPRLARAFRPHRAPPPPPSGCRP